jgi:hypothetical protein
MKTFQKHKKKIDVNKKIQKIMKQQFNRNTKKILRALPTQHTTNNITMCRCN